MGGLNSCCIPRHLNSDMDMSTSTSTPKKKGHHRNLSAAFNLSVIDDSNKHEKNLVNINTATEEELMTLPGINRSIAKNIIDYRNHIGGFRCVEDVALASGVGAAKLKMIQDDIYVVPLAFVQNDTSREQLDEPAQLNNSTCNSDLIVSVNSDNVFTLMKVKGIGMTMAKSIVAYREKHGKFKSLDELLKVKDIGPANLESIQPYLTVKDTPKQTAAPDNVQHQSNANGKVPERTMNNGNAKQDYIRRSTASFENLLEMLGPLAKVPERPKVGKITLKCNNRKVVRLASWNLEKFSLEKAGNPGVKDVICMTILENGFGVVAIQELADKKALSEICQELNSPTLPNVKKWKGKRGQWTYAVSEPTGRMYQSMEYNGFLYDKSQGIELMKSCLLENAPGQPKPFTRMPYLGIFKVDGKFDCVIVSVHLKAAGLADEDKSKTEKEADTISEVMKAIKRTLKGEKDIIIVGDFNLVADAKAFDHMCAEGYKPCISAETFTNISNKNPAGSKNYDNIWINTDTQVFTGVSGVVREGLTSPWIPNGWSWGGVVSDHCPVYAQLYCDVDLDSGDVTAKDVKFTLTHG